MAQFLKQGRIIHLRAVSLNDAFENGVAVCRCGEELNRHTLFLRGRRKQIHVSGRDRLPVKKRARGLAHWDRLIQLLPPRLRGRQGYVDPWFGPRPDHNMAGTTNRSSCNYKVLGRAAKADKKVVVVRIDDRGATRDVWEDADLSVVQAEQPRLRVVAVRCKRRHPDKLFKPGIAGKKLPLAINLFAVTVHARPETVSGGTQGSERKAGPECGSARDECHVINPQVEDQDQYAPDPRTPH